MPVFQYEGMTATGETRRGEIEADTESAAQNKLRSMQIRNPKVKKKALDLNIDLLAIMGIESSVPEKDLVIFTRQFATMIDSGLPLVQCLDIQYNQATNPTFKKQLKTIKETVEGGSTFGDALKKFDKTFDTLYVSLVAAGEVGGILDTILNRLANYIEKSSKLKSQVKGSLTYPIGVSVVATIVVAILLTYVVPTFKTMFESSGKALPAPTQALIDISAFFQAYILHMIGVVVVSFFAIRAIYKTPQGHLAIDKMFLQSPIFGEVLTKVAVARFCRTLGTMVSSGVPILDALEICSKTAGNKVVENAILRARESISEGKTIAEPLTESKVFPSMVCQMISVGEATGALDTMLGKIADFYDDEVDSAVTAMTKMLEPAIMAVLGVIVGGIMIALYMPIFTMAGAIGG